MSMTSVVTRSPLHNLSMNGAQTNGTKRKSTRIAFDPDDDAPPTKKTKGDGASKALPAQATSNTRGTNGRVASTAKPRTKKSYEEDDDGFAFSRARSTRAKSKAITSDNAQESEPQQQLSPIPASPEPAKTKRKPSKTLPTTPELERPAKHPATRRSKRLSAENNQANAASSDLPSDVPKHMAQPAQPAPPAKPNAHAVHTPRAVDQPAEPEASPVLQDGQEAQSLHIDKKRRVTKIPLPFADTPILRRNKEMRKLSAEQSRRSSSGMRGRRASSLIDAGSSSAVPHLEVETQDFYKHISQDLVEPKRMRQLLIWCGHRTLPEKAGGQMEAAETAAVHAARVIQEELLGEFGSRNDMSSWFDREEAPPTVLVKKPNPRNIQNAEKLQQLEAELARLQLEKRNWDDLTKATPTPTSQANAPVSISLDPSDIDVSLLDPSQAEILRTLFDPAQTKAVSHSNPPPSSSSTALDIVNDARQRIASIAQSLEFKIDQFADSTHRLEQYRQTADRVAERVLSTGARKLEEKEQKLHERSGGKGDIVDTLRGLGRVLNDKGRR